MYVFGEGESQLNREQVDRFEDLVVDLFGEVFREDSFSGNVSPDKQEVQMVVDRMLNLVGSMRSAEGLFEESLKL